MKKKILLVIVLVLLSLTLATPVLAADPPGMDVDVDIVTPGDVDLDMEITSGGDVDITIDGVDFQDAAAAAYAALHAVGGISGGIDLNDFIRHFYWRIAPYENAINQNASVINFLGEAQAKLISEYQAVSDELKNSNDLTDGEIAGLNDKLEQIGIALGEVGNNLITANTKNEAMVAGLQSQLDTMNEEFASEQAAQNTNIQGNADFSNQIIAWVSQYLVILASVVVASLIIGIAGLVKACRR